MKAVQFPAVAIIATLTVGLALPLSADDPRRLDFSPTEPTSVGLNPAAIEKLSAAVQRYVDTGDTVGAELAIIKDGKLVFRKAYGLRDMTDRSAIQSGGIYCIRSMSKTFVGAAVQMLIDEGKLKLDDKASKFLPAFDRDDKRAITIEQLLEHRSGLPLSSLIEHPVDKIKSVQDVAALAAEQKLEFEPGTAFNYSDDGTDTLAAVVEKVSGMPADRFITERIIQPLGLRDTVCYLGADDPRMKRVVSNHLGGKGAWSRYWKPGDAPIFKCFLGSQSMYSSIDDYAAFLMFWLDGKTPDGKRLLSPAAIERARTPASLMGYPTQLSGLTVAYGQLMMLYVPEKTTEADVRKAKPVIFGHGGSDGTMAWLWPEQKLLVLYFTQSRGGLSAISIEAELDKRLIKGDASETTTSQPAFADLLGFYHKKNDDSYTLLLEKDEKLQVEFPGRFVLALSPAGKTDEWRLELDPGTRLKFERDAAGKVGGMSVTAASGEGEHFERFEPDKSLPSIDQVAAEVSAAHGVARMSGMVRRSGVLDLGARGKGTYAALVSATRCRVDLEAAGQRTRIISDGKKVQMRRGSAAAEELSGGQLEQSLLEQPQFVFGDWRKQCPDVRVVARVKLGERNALVVRAAPREANAITLFVDEETHRIVRMDRISVASGLGPLGVKTTYDEFVEVGGTVLPKRVTAVYATPLIGTTIIQFDEATAQPVEDAALFTMETP